MYTLPVCRIQIWTFTFCGSGKSKYTNELLELACSFEYEFSEDLKAAICSNWLCNLTGYEGCHFPMDLLQEHLIKELKSMTEDRSAPFGEVFFKEIISCNIRYFLEVKTVLRTAVGLGDKSGSHKQKKKAIALNMLGKAMQEAQLHRYRRGRTLGHVAHDDFAAGNNTLSGSSRIADFVKRTLPVGNVEVHNSNTQSDDDESNKEHHDVAEDDEDIDEDQDLNNEFRQIPLPNMWQDGELILGDDTSDEDSEDDVDENA